MDNNGLAGIILGILFILYNKYKGTVIDKLKDELNVAKEDTKSAALDQKQKDIEEQIAQQQQQDQHVKTDDKTIAENIDKI